MNVFRRAGAAPKTAGGWREPAPEIARWRGRLAFNRMGRSGSSQMKIVLSVLAAIGGLPLIAVLGMFLMHGTMMRGMM